MDILKQIPKTILWLCIACSLAPEYMDHFEYLYIDELSWFLLLFPSFIIAFYLGLRGGVTAGAVAISYHFMNFFLKHHFHISEGKQEELALHIGVSVVSFFSTVGVGILSDKLKENQKQIQRLNNNLEKIAMYDSLTGLPNRHYLMNKLEETFLNQQTVRKSRDDNKHFCILFIDLDRFKPVNDTYGHHVGDLLLQEVTRRLKECVTEQDFIARMGGDEFIVLIQNTTKTYSFDASQKIIKELSKAFQIEGKDIFITASIGISLSSADEVSFESILQQADIAMYAAKKKGKNGYCLYYPGMKESTENTMVLENKLRKALERNEFSLYYQPQLDVASGQIMGIEALIRWVPDGEMVTPGNFISIAEETGLIIPIGQWVLETACNQMKRWVDSGHPPVQISVNVSSKQFIQPNFIQIVKKVLKETQLNPGLLRLELTESIFLGNEKSITEKLTKLKELGVSISIDDFGTGYSSLMYLKSFPIDEIKIDKSFIHEIPYNHTEVSLVQAIIKLGFSLNAKVVAEGVETEEQLKFLEKSGCDLIQGYLIGKPMPMEEVESLFQQEIVLSYKLYDIV